MPELANTLRATTAAALTVSFFCLNTAAATAGPNNGTPADINRLAASLSKGYGLNNCNPQPLVDQGELAELLCGQNPDPGGPTRASYELFTNSADLGASFTANLSEFNSMTSCGNDGPSPSAWHQANSSQTLGQLACGIYQNQAVIHWTDNGKNSDGVIIGGSNDVNALYQWWRINS